MSSTQGKPSTKQILSELERQAERFGVRTDSSPVWKIPVGPAWIFDSPESNTVCGYVQPDAIHQRWGYGVIPPYWRSVHSQGQLLAYFETALREPFSWWPKEFRDAFTPKEQVVIGAHSHRSIEELLVVRGKVVLETPTDRVVLREGGSYVLRPDELHSGVAVEDSLVLARFPRVRIAFNSVIGD